MTFTSSLLRSGLGLVAAGFAGWAATRFFADGLSRLEIAAWSLAVGLLVQCAILLGCFAAGMEAGVETFLLGDALLVAASLVLLRHRSEPQTQTGGSRGRWVAVVALAVVAATAWGLSLVQALSEPMWATDYLAIWGLKGKIIFLGSGLPSRLFSDPALIWANRDYPVLVPLSLAALAKIAGAWNDQALALLWPACELATLLALVGFLGRRVSRSAGAGAAALSALCFPLYGPANIGTAEIPCALAFVLVCCAVLDVLDEASTARLARLAAASAFCVSIKQEGSTFVLFAAALLFVRLRKRPDRSGSRAVAALLAPLAVHAGLLRLLTGPQAHRAFDLTLLVPRRWSELPPLFGTVVARLIGTEARAAFVALLAIAGYLLVTRRGIGDALWPIFAAQMGCYCVAFTLSAFGPTYAIDSAFRRLALTLFPSLTLLLCARRLRDSEPSS
jgi:Dolichyl-phosphate-mannose-protein mannosyltransferase